MMLQSKPSQSKFVAELRRRFGTPRAVMKHLGLDASLLDEFKPGNGNGNGGGAGSEGDAELWRMRKAIEKVIEEAAKSNEISDAVQAELGNVLDTHCGYGIKNSHAEKAAEDEEEHRPRVCLQAADRRRY